MNKEIAKNLKIARRKKRVRAKINGTLERPRLSVFRSLKGMYLQLIDDENGKTLVSAGSWELKDTKGKKIEISALLGELLAKKALEKKIASVVFDRAGHKYHGRVKAVAEGARKGGLKF